MPLSVDYREKSRQQACFPGGFLKRESRPSDEEILIAVWSTALFVLFSPAITTPKP
jgi:hypothetical protein